MQWEEKLFWISRGVRTILTIEIACPAHGVYRAELTEEQSNMLALPVLLHAAPQSSAKA
jgi:hypothetical protein